MSKELTENQKHNFCNDAIIAKRNIEWKFLEFGAMLHKIKAERYYEAGWSSWEEFEMELKMSSATISKLLRIYETFVLRYEFKPQELAHVGGWSVVAEFLPLVKEDTPKKEIVGWLSGAKEQTRADIRRTITEKKTGVSMATCKHKDTYTITICRDCGERWTDDHEHN